MWKGSRVKLKAFIIILTLLSPGFTYASNVTQTKPDNAIEIQVKNATLKQVFALIEKQTDYAFIYNAKDVDINKTFSFAIKSDNINATLEEVLSKANLNYEIYNDNIIIKRQAQNQQPQSKEINFNGTVVDSEGFPLPGANVINQNGQGTVTDVHGKFTILVREGDEFTISFIGMTSESHVVPEVSSGVLAISRKFTLQDDEKILNEVVANGYFVRKKDTYTGNTNTIAGDDLIQMGTENIMKSLNVLDPSFQIIENNDLGSNPNATPEIRFRGTASFSETIFDEGDRNLLKTDPNQPTFIMDGFEVTIQDVMDLDMYRVESITILKDAVAASIYGARAANGVIIIKTKKPKKGYLQATYNLNLGFQIADLSTYNLLTGPELFDLQKKLGLYSLNNPNTVTKYNQINKWLYEGVNSDWISQPIRNAVTQRHSLQLAGGSDDMRYGINFGYNTNPGVMKGSMRDNYNVAVNLNYDLNKKLQFAYNISLTKNENNDGPYGSFSNYSRLPNYFPMYNRQGQLLKTFEDNDGSDSWGQRPRFNPLYEAQQGNFSKGNYINVINNLSANYQINKDLRLNSTVAYTINRTEKETFLSPNSLDYQASSTPVEDRGKYTKDNISLEGYDVNIMLNYMKMVDKHHYSFSAGTNIMSKNNIATGFVAQGFSNGMYFPSHSNGYEINGIPRGQESLSRMIGFLTSANYSYKNTYMLDATFRADGSSAYGKDQRFAPFFSVGTGYNVHNEDWMKEVRWVERLRLRATYGETGSIAFSPYQSKDMFEYFTEYRYLGDIGVSLKALGNDALVWQTTKSSEFGIDANIFKRIDINFSLYNRRTEDMIAPLDLPPSLGFAHMTANIGTMENKGFDFNTRAHIYKGTHHNLHVSVSGARNRNKIVELNGDLKSYNERAEKEAGDTNDPSKATRFVSRYVVGGSNSDLYAVRSLGIDPETGQELFLDKDGVPTWEWNSSDMVVVGNSLPDLEGSIIINYTFKRLNVGINSMYRIGGQDYNRTLIEKVENSDKYMNVDRRVYEETWQKPGDRVSFKANVGNEVTYASSRFIQNNNVFYISGINLNYNVPNKICEKLSLKTVNVGLNLNDIFYTSTIERERGIDYPFARSFTFNLRTNF